MMSGDTIAAIREMNDAFEGEQEINYTATVDKNDKLTVTRVVTKGPQKEITALPYADNEFALVPIDDDPDAAKK